MIPTDFIFLFIIRVVFFMIWVDPSPILFHFYFFIRSELVRVGPSWSGLTFVPASWNLKRFEASRVVFWSLSCYKELKLTTNWFTGRTLHGLLIQMQNISSRSSGMRRKQNFEIVFGFKSDAAVLTLTFRFLPSFFAFLASFFFPCWAFSRLRFGGKSF